MNSVLDSVRDMSGQFCVHRSLKQEQSRVWLGDM